MSRIAGISLWFSLLAVEVIADEERKHQSAWECFPFADSPTCLFWPGSFSKTLIFPVFPWNNCHVFWVSFCPLSLFLFLSYISLPLFHKHSHIYLYTSYLNSSVCVRAVSVSGDWCGILPHSCSGKIPDVRKLISPPRLGHVVGQEVLHQAPLNSLGDCSSQPNGNKARGAGSGEISPPPPPPAPKGSSQACAINFLTIYSQVEFIFPEEPHMWCISGFRLWGWGRRSWLWSQSIKVATNSVFLEGCLL